MASSKSTANLYVIRRKDSQLFSVLAAALVRFANIFGEAILFLGQLGSLTRTFIFNLASLVPIHPQGTGLSASNIMPLIYGKPGTSAQRAKNNTGFMR